MVVAESTEGELPAGTQVLRRYSIVGKLAQGGMAEVYLARQVGPAGYQKLVVIKRVRPHLANDSDFVGMFVNEARLAAMINHPNVVQIFDLGDEPRPAAQGGGQDWFLAMEYLDGRDMLQVGRACRSHNKAVPFDVTARIIADACAGLDHAHNLKGEGNKSLDLVHRDMSPENILITFEGQVKVVDFGIAKASDNLIKTQAGQIKGKLGYVAPEAILGKPVDARADVFAVGATLYLFLSGRPAFSGTNPMEIFERSLRPPVPPKEVNPRVPEQLDAICMKALAQDRDKRYRSAGEVRTALDSYLQSTGRPLGPLQLAQFMRILFPADKDPVRQRIDKMLAEAPIPAALPMTPSMVRAAGFSVVPVVSPVNPPPQAQHNAPAPILVDDDKTNVVHPKDLMSVPEPITMQSGRPTGPTHLRSMAVEAEASVPSGHSIEDMTNEDIDLRTLAAHRLDVDSSATLQSPAPQATPAPSEPSVDAAELEAIAAAISEDDDLDLDVDMNTSTQASPLAEARRFQASMDAAADAFDASIKTQSGDDEALDLPPPPLDPSGLSVRPGTAAGAPRPPPAPASAPPPDFYSPAAAAPPPAFAPSAYPSAPPAAPFAAPATFVPEIAPFQLAAEPSAEPSPGLALKLAMLGFGCLTGVVFLLLILWVSGGLAQIFRV